MSPSAPVTGFNKKPPAPVQVLVLGRFTILVNGQTLHFSGRPPQKPLELLKVLVALGGESVSAEVLCDELWPEADGDQANHALHTTIARLRKLIGADTVNIQNTRVSLNPEHCWVDAIACAHLLNNVERELGEGNTEEALAILESTLTLYRGPLLEGEFAPGSIMTARSRLHGMILRMVIRAGEALYQQSKFQEAVNLYRHALERDDQTEEVYQGLLRACLASGRRADGLAAYTHCHDVLKHGLESQPSSETENLHQALLELSNGSSKQTVPTSPSKQIDVHATPSAPGTARQHRLGLFGLGFWHVVAGLLIFSILGLGTYAGWQYFQTKSDALALAGFKNKTLLPLPDKPSIAVMAFDNLSGDPNQEYFSDGLSDNIITQLSKVREMMVISRNSTFKYKGKRTDTRQIGRELGVRYVLEGSVQRSRDTVRITVQLIDAVDGANVWAEAFDRKLIDLLAVQDEITTSILGIIPGAISTASMKASLNKTASENPDDFTAMDYVWRSRYLREKGKEIYHKAYLLEAIQFAEKALELKPKLVHAYIEKSKAEFEIAYQFGEKAFFKSAYQTIKQAEAIDANYYDVHHTLGVIYYLQKKFDQSWVALERSIKLNPNGATGLNFLGQVYSMSGREEEGLALGEKSLRLNPLYISKYATHTSLIYYFNGRYVDAINMAKRDTRKDYGTTVRILAASNVKLRNFTEARAYARILLNKYPGFSLQSLGQKIPIKSKEVLNDYLATLRKAGLPD